jgi:hypothetical protein
MKYPATKFAKKTGAAKHNGRSVYQVWRYLDKREGRVVGEIYKTGHGTWNLKITSRTNVQADEDLQRLNDAKQRARELLD